MKKSLILAAAALALSAAAALAQNAPATQGYDNGVQAPAKVQRIARHEKTMQSKVLYDYAPAAPATHAPTLYLFGVAY